MSLVEEAELLTQELIEQWAGVIDERAHIPVWLLARLRDSRIVEAASTGRVTAEMLRALSIVARSSAALAVVVAGHAISCSLARRKLKFPATPVVLDPNYEIPSGSLEASAEGYRVRVSGICLSVEAREFVVVMRAASELILALCDAGAVRDAHAYATTGLRGAGIGIVRLECNVSERDVRTLTEDELREHMMSLLRCLGAVAVGLYEFVRDAYEDLDLELEHVSTPSPEELTKASPEEVVSLCGNITAACARGLHAAALAALNLGSRLNKAIRDLITLTGVVGALERVLSQLSRPADRSSP